MHYRYWCSDKWLLSSYVRRGWGIAPTCFPRKLNNSHVGHVLAITPSTCNFILTTCYKAWNDPFVCPQVLLWIAKQNNLKKKKDPFLIFSHCTSTAKECDHMPSGNNRVINRYGSSIGGKDQLLLTGEHCCTYYPERPLRWPSCPWY